MGGGGNTETLPKPLGEGSDEGNASDVQEGQRQVQLPRQLPIPSIPEGDPGSSVCGGDEPPVLATPRVSAIARLLLSVSENKLKFEKP